MPPKTDRVKSSRATTYREIWEGRHPTGRTSGGLTRNDLVLRRADGTVVYPDGTEVPPATPKTSQSKVVSRKRYEQGLARWKLGETIAQDEADHNGKRVEAGSRVWRNAEGVITSAMKPNTPGHTASMTRAKSAAKLVLK